VADALRVGGAAEIELVRIVTSGDRGAAGDKLRFVKEIDDALLRGDVDLAVHSAKDLPAELPGEIVIAAVPPAEDPRDVLCGAASIEALAPGARVGTASVRRRSQLLAIRSDLEIQPLRGNVDTRLRRLAEGDQDAIVLALAGLRRLNRDDAAGAALDVDTFVPAPGQGALAVTARAGGAARETAAALEDVASRARLDAERAAVKALGATCHTPVGIAAVRGGDEIDIRGYAGMPDGSDWISDRLRTSAVDPAAAGVALAERMIAAGAGDLLERAELLQQRLGSPE
jgi:hydroxymethylbilane synthase